MARLCEDWRCVAWAASGTRYCRAHEELWRLQHERLVKPKRRSPKRKGVGAVQFWLQPE